VDVDEGEEEVGDSLVGAAALGDDMIMMMMD